MNLHNVTLEKTAYRPGDYPKRLPEFALGRSRVGKSSMLNKLLSRTTRGSAARKNAVECFYNIDDTVYLTDLPSLQLRQSLVVRPGEERAMIEHYFAAGRDIPAR